MNGKNKKISSKKKLDKFYIKGPTRLFGKVRVSGAKNSALPILFASLLTEFPIELKNIPKLKDIENTVKLLKYLGAKIKERNKCFYVDTSSVNKFCAPYELVKDIRASIWLLAPLLARFGKGRVYLPGGCSIGSRPIDLHIKGLQELGAKIKIENKCIIARTSGRLEGKIISMKKISVGATLTIMSAATLAKGTTVIENSAKEPEIVDTANFLIGLGANIFGAGTDTIIIKGVKTLQENKSIYKILPDRIETGTFLVAAAISRGKIVCKKTCPNILRNVILKLKEAGADIKIGKDWIKLNMHGKRPKGVKIYTAPYDGFPTDMQSQFSLLNLVAKGKSLVTENIFENRFMHIPQLKRMGAKVKFTKKNTILCHGVKNLFGTQVVSTDLRSAASLVLAGCIAHGITVVKKASYIDRGYEDFEKKMQKIGANIKRM
ncbi:UDP-N-acetylglucosamine 1-carboxyvinyltransferase [bacterium endosymbiont of Pedicinus badii]|uniref:UDP-N-acetylglucosamine 1-carboxyvinyltransferase n=1 Tax=bacterium endosymbiont of Pedicinus badii TaxID=1719126 RepID=UPI0009BA312E|nr:UDP-N-acetylglucosamine 1-carboxyvinyltransferase [bacterium endosymbiont of Pedicinus badii]OQM34149.1 UDP-N-acetylglucosamine 1-carboxyvinyltransferase [bacterium endosymbiont of Pedicinus badii]